MTAAETVQREIDRARAAAAEEGISEQNSDAYVVGWLRVELEKALEALTGKGGRA